MSVPPWSILGLNGPADERAIRSAFARQLKLTRPDDHPKAFQALIEARNAAVLLARGRGEAPYSSEAKSSQDCGADGINEAVDTVNPHAGRSSLDFPVSVTATNEEPASQFADEDRANTIQDELRSHSTVSLPVAIQLAPDFGQKPPLTSNMAPVAPAPFVFSLDQTGDGKTERGDAVWPCLNRNRSRFDGQPHPARVATAS